MSVQRVHLSDLPAPAKKKKKKCVQETPSKSKPKTHQRQREKGRVGKEEDGESSRLQTEPKNPQKEYFHAVEISYCTIYLALVFIHTRARTKHTHTHTQTHLFHTHTGRHPTRSHIQTHALTQTGVMKTVSSKRNLQQPLCAADGRAHCYLPRPVQDQKNIQKIRGGGEAGSRSIPNPSPPTPRQMRPARSESVSSRGVCSQGAPDYGKVINLGVLQPLHPHPHHSAACIEMIARAVSVPILLHFAQPSDAASETQWRQEY